MFNKSQIHIISTQMLLDTLLVSDFRLKEMTQSTFVGTPVKNGIFIRSPSTVSVDKLIHLFISFQ
jgi:hypothetical protein